MPEACCQDLNYCKFSNDRDISFLHVAEKRSLHSTILSIMSKVQDASQDYWNKLPSVNAEGLRCSYGTIEGRTRLHSYCWVTSP